MAVDNFACILQNKVKRTCLRPSKYVRYSYYLLSREFFKYVFDDMGSEITNLIFVITNVIVITGRQSYQTFFLCKQRIFPFFADKLGHFIANAFFSICNKHSSLLAKIGKPEK